MTTNNDPWAAAKLLTAEELEAKLHRTARLAKSFALHVIDEVDWTVGLTEANNNSLRELNRIDDELEALVEHGWCIDEVDEAINEAADEVSYLVNEVVCSAELNLRFSNDGCDENSEFYELWKRLKAVDLAA